MPFHLGMPGLPSSWPSYVLIWALSIECPHLLLYSLLLHVFSHMRSIEISRGKEAEKVVTKRRKRRHQRPIIAHDKTALIPIRRQITNSDGFLIKCTAKYLRAYLTRGNTSLHLNLPPK